MSQGVGTDRCGTDRCGLRATGTLLSAACAFDLGHVSIVIITLVVALLAESTSGCAWQASSSPRARGAEHLCNQLGPDEAHLPSLEVGLGVRVGLAREVGSILGCWAGGQMSPNNHNCNDGHTNDDMSGSHNDGR